MAFRVVKSIAQGSKVRSKTRNNLIVMQTRCFHPSYLENLPSTNITTLNSGLRVATSDGLGDVATIGLWIDVGSANENEQQNGVANFLQNLALRGTAKRSKSQLDRDVESLGVKLNSYITREKTAFFAQALKDDVPKVVEILADIVKNTNFKEDQIEKTRAHILKEQAVLKERFDLSLFDHLHAAAYQGSSHAMSPLGESSTVKNIKNSDLVSFARNFYTAPNIVLVGTGAVKHNELVALANTTLSGLPTTPRTPPFESIDYVGSEIRIRDDTEHTIRTVFAYEGVGIAHPQYWTFLFLKKMIGNWTSSGLGNGYKGTRLAEVTANEKLVHSYRTFYYPYNTTGLFGIYSESSSDKVEDFTYHFFNEMQKISMYTNDHEFQLVKNQLKADLLVCLENPTNFAHNIGENVLGAGRALPIAELYKRIDSIDISDVKSLVETYLTDVDPVIVTHGKNEEVPEYNTVRNWTYWNRW